MQVVHEDVRLGLHWHEGGSPETVHAGLRHVRHQQQLLQVAGIARTSTLRVCRAYQQSQASNALQQSAQLSQQQECMQETQQLAYDAERHQHIVDDYNLTYW